VSAPVGPRSSHSTLRAGCVANRWAGVIVGTDGAVCAVGVRCDDEDRRVGEALIVDLGPGQIRARARLHFTVRAVAGTAAAPIVLDECGGLWRIDNDAAPVRLADGVHALVDRFALGENGVVLAVDKNPPRRVAEGARHVGAGVMVVDGGVQLIDRMIDDDTVLPLIPVALPPHVSACHRDGAHVAIAGDKTVTLLDLAAGTARTLHAPRRIQSLARSLDRWLLGSTSSGLHVLDDGDDVVRALRPSLRAHQLARFGDAGVVAVADLSISTTDDGVEWLGRDLAGLVRLMQA
jgi:hypothetical protein